MARLNKLASAVFAAVLVLALITPSAGASAAPALAVVSGGAPRGSAVTVEVDLTDPGSIAGGNFNIVYDSSALTLQDAAAGKLLTGTMCSINKQYANNALRVTFAGASALAASGGAVVTLTFLVKAEAGLGKHDVTLNNVRLYDIDGAAVSGVTVISGSVSAQYATISVSSKDCTAGNAVKLSVSIGGDILPAGGSFEIAYDTSKLIVGSVKAENIQPGASLSANTVYGQGVIKVSWAGTEGLTAAGEICTLIFNVKLDAAGSAAVTPQNVRLYDMNGILMDCVASAGSAHIISSYEKRAKLYIVGGVLESNGSSSINVAVDGADTVCGGGFTLSFDPAKCTLVSTTPVATAAINTGTAGAVGVSWADDSPSLDNVTIIRLKFLMKNGAKNSDVFLSAVKLYDESGAPLKASDFDIRDGKIGLTTEVQDPVVAAEQIVQTHGTGDTVLATTVNLSIELYDGTYDTQSPTTGGNAVLAMYEGGKMKTVGLPKGSISFDKNGIAEFSAEISCQGSADSYALFILDSSGKLTPIASKLSAGIMGDA